MWILAVMSMKTNLHTIEPKVRYKVMHRGSKYISAENGIQIDSHVVMWNGRIKLGGERQRDKRGNMGRERTNIK